MPAPANPSFVIKSPAAQSASRSVAAGGRHALADLRRRPAGGAHRWAAAAD